MPQKRDIFNWEYYKKPVKTCPATPIIAISYGIKTAVAPDKVLTQTWIRTPVKSRRLFLNNFVVNLRYLYRFSTII